MPVTYIIPCAGLSTRNFPHSKGIAHKSLLPFGNVRLIDHILKDIITIGGKDIVFICSNQKAIDAFKEALGPAPEIKKKLNDNPKTKYIAEILQSTEIPKNIRIRYVIQKDPKGNAHAFGLGCRLAKGNAAAMIFPDDIYVSENPKKPHLKKILAAFEKNKKQILITGIKMKDVSNNSILEKDRLIEKPKKPSNFTGGFSPMIFPKEVCKHFADLADKIEKGVKVKEMVNGKECIYTDAVNSFLDTNEKKGFSVKMFLKDKADIYMDTGTLELYKKALLASLL